MAAKEDVSGPRVTSPATTITKDEASSTCGFSTEEEHPQDGPSCIVGVGGQLVPSQTPDAPRSPKNGCSHSSVQDNKTSTPSSLKDLPKFMEPLENKESSDFSQSSDKDPHVDKKAEEHLTDQSSHPVCEVPGPPREAEPNNVHPQEHPHDEPGCIVGVGGQLVAPQGPGVPRSPKNGCSHLSVQDNKSNTPSSLEDLPKCKEPQENKESSDLSQSSDKDPHVDKKAEEHLTDQSSHPVCEVPGPPREAEPNNVHPQEHPHDEPGCIVGVGGQLVAPQGPGVPRSPKNGCSHLSVQDNKSNTPSSLEDLPKCKEPQENKESSDLSQSSDKDPHVDKKAEEHLTDQSSHPVCEVLGPPREAVPNTVHFDPFKTIYKWMTSRSSKYIHLILSACLVALLLIQVFLVGVDIFRGSSQQSSHSKCVSDVSRSYPIISLRILSRVILPGCILVYFWCWITDNPACVVRKKFLAEILNPRNNETASELIKRFVNPFFEDQLGTRHHLEEIQKDLDKRLKCMILLSCLVAVVLTIALTAFSVFDLLTTNSFVLIILGVADIISFGFLLVMCGTVLSLLFLDMEIKKYFRQFRAYCTDKQLKLKAKAVDDSISNRWYPMSVLVNILTVLYCVLLIISWSSGIPLSCGVSIDTEVLMNDSPSAYWLVFLIVLAVGQFSGTSPYSYSFSVVSIAVETIILLLLYFCSPSKEWSEFTHILYATIPLSYFLWYHILALPRQWAGIRIALGSSSNMYWILKIVMHTSLITLIIVNVCLSGYTEYNHMNPSAIDQFSTSASMQWNPKLGEYGDQEMIAKLMFEHYQKHCAFHPYSHPPDSSIPCLHLDPRMFKDKEMQNMISKTITIVQLVWSAQYSNSRHGELSNQSIKFPLVPPLSSNASTVT
jgi:hypothetical protein